MICFHVGLLGIFYDDLRDCKRILRILKNRENFIPPFNIVFVQKIPIQNCFWVKPFLFVSRFSFFLNAAHFWGKLSTILCEGNILPTITCTTLLENMYEMPISEIWNHTLGLVKLYSWAVIHHIVKK